MRAVVLALVLCWSSRAVAGDPAADGKKLATEAVARYEAVVEHRGLTARLWDAAGNSVYKNLEHAREDFDSKRADFNKAVADQAKGSLDGSEFEVNKRREVMQQAVERLDDSLASYKTDSAAIVWKLQLALGVLVAAAIGTFIWSRRKKR